MPEHFCHIGGSKFSWKRFGKDMLKTGEIVVYYFTIGVILAGLLRYFIPAGWVTRLVGGGKWYSTALAGMAGVPFYACGGGTLPLVRVMVEKGMTPGAALAFLTAGPATRITPLAALAAVLNKRILVYYVFLVFVGATILGYVYDFVPQFIPMPPPPSSVALGINVQY